MTDFCPPNATPVRLDTLKAEEIRAAVDALNALVGDAQEQGLTVEFDTLPLSRMTGPVTSLLTVTVRKEI